MKQTQMTIWDPRGVVARMTEGAVGFERKTLQKTVKDEQGRESKIDVGESLKMQKRADIAAALGIDKNLDKELLNLHVQELEDAAFQKWWADMQPHIKEIGLRGFTARRGRQLGEFTMNVRLHRTIRPNVDHESIDRCFANGLITKEQAEQWHAQLDAKSEKQAKPGTAEQTKPAGELKAPETTPAS